MSVEEKVEIALDPLSALQLCAERLRKVQQEADEGLRLVHEVLASLSRTRSSLASSDLQSLLDVHHARIEASLASVMSGVPEGAPSRFELRLDPHERTARIGRRRVPLSESEFKVIELLWEQRPTPVSRRMLLDHLYRDKEQPSEAAIDMYIFHIRQKLKSAGCSDTSIETIKGQGWALRSGEAADREADEAP